jgi:protein-tyrosine phosphatase
MTSQFAMSVLMVCMGNICRSPTAEAVLRHKLRDAHMDTWVTVDSAGTHAWHEGEPPDVRSVRHARLRRYDLTAIRARAVTAHDFERFDLILAMDWDNLALLQQQCPPSQQHKLHLLGEFAATADHQVVPDPYQGGPADFDHVLNVVEDACDGVVSLLSKTIYSQTGGTS